MRRTLIFLEWKASWWEERALVTQFQRAHAEGASAYAWEQVDVYRSLRRRFEQDWERNEDGSFVMYKRGRKGYRWKERVVSAWETMPISQTTEGNQFKGSQSEEEVQEANTDEEEEAGEEWDDDNEDDELDLEDLETAGKYSAVVTV